MHLLPPNLAALADLCRKDSGANDRYSPTAGVHLRVHGDNTYRAIATDCKCAAIVTGPCDDPAEYPNIPGLATAANGQTEATIPAATFKAALKPLAKSRSKPILQNTAVVIGESMTTFANTDLDRCNVTPTRTLDGRFPAVVDCLPAGDPLVSVRVDPRVLAKLLKAATAFTNDEDTGVTIEIRAKGSMVVLAATGGQHFTGILVPLAVTVANARCED